jgi:hypothetical protein
MWSLETKLQNEKQTNEIEMATKPYQPRFQFKQTSFKIRKTLTIMAYMIAKSNIHH